MSKSKVRQEPLKATNSIRIFSETHRQLKILAAQHGETLSYMLHELVMSGTLGHDLVAVLSEHCGETGKNEGAVKTLKRIIRERNYHRSLTSDE